jgi:hypothetical protein
LSAESAGICGAGILKKPSAEEPRKQLGESDPPAENAQAGLLLCMDQNKNEYSFHIYSGYLDNTTKNPERIPRFPRKKRESEKPKQIFIHFF